MAATKVSLKLFIDKKSQRVLYAEAHKEFVDFLLFIFTMPVGAVTQLLQKQNMTEEQFVRNVRTYVAVANDRRAICPSCMNTMNSELRYVEYRARDINASSSSEGGYVKGLITYMVMDDLDVKPISMSTISAISLLTKLNVTNVGAVEEKVIDFGIDEGVKLLKASIYAI